MYFRVEQWVKLFKGWYHKETCRPLSSFCSWIELCDLKEKWVLLFHFWSPIYSDISTHCSLFIMSTTTPCCTHSELSFILNVKLYWKNYRITYASDSKMKIIRFKYLTNINTCRHLMCSVDTLSHTNAINGCNKFK